MREGPWDPPWSIVGFCKDCSGFTSHPASVEEMKSTLRRVLYPEMKGCSAPVGGPWLGSRFVSRVPEAGGTADFFVGANVTGEGARCLSH